MEVLSIQQHARDTLSRLRMRKRNKNWARDHMSWGNLLEGGDGTETWARGAAQRRIWWVVAGQRLGGPAQRLDRGGWWMCGVWTEAGQRRIWVGQRRIWVVLRLDRGESGLHRGEAGDWAKQGLHRDVGRRAVQRWRLVAIELRFGLLLRQCGG
ncbi:hypothetical protein Acr_05g0000080 [Actinidia rufa]|uniref:Uncharacterized protein n=1 Tax=Actinidia rufa TaxID=165716 RepID=A0A7J0EKB7_9ERIC|nr:hypothetical protein Acr_05g0000080 [Actinidia rufa]